MSCLAMSIATSRNSDRSRDRRVLSKVSRSLLRGYLKDTLGLGLSLALFRTSRQKNRHAKNHEARSIRPPFVLLSNR